MTRTKHNSLIWIVFGGAASLVLHAVLLSLPAFGTARLPEPEQVFEVRLQPEPSTPDVSSVPAKENPARKTAAAPVEQKTAPVQSPAQQPAIPADTAATDTANEIPATPAPIDQSNTAPPDTSHAGQTTANTNTSTNTTAGSDGGQGASNNTGASQSEIDKIMGAYKRDLTGKISERKVYPRSAQQRGQTGTAQLSFTLDRSGKIVDGPRVIGTSGNLSLDNAAIAAVAAAARFFSPLPVEDPRQKIEFTIPIAFELR